MKAFLSTSTTATGEAKGTGAKNKHYVYDWSHKAVPKKLNEAFVPSAVTIKRSMFSMLAGQTGMFQEINMLMNLVLLSKDTSKLNASILLAYSNSLINNTQTLTCVLSEWLRTGDIGADVLHQILRDPIFEYQFFACVIHPNLVRLKHLVQNKTVHIHTLLKADTKQCISQLLYTTPVEWMTNKYYRDCLLHVTFKMLTSCYRLVTLSDYVDLMVVDLIKSATIKK